MRNHMMTFKDYILRIDKYLSVKCKTDWNYEQMFYSVSDKIEGHSPIYMCHQNGSIHVGIGHANEYYDDNETNIEYAVWRFLTLLTCKIKRTDFTKGNMIFKTTFETLECNTKPYKVFAATWFFPYWKRTVKHETFQEPIISIDDIKREFADIKLQQIS